MFRAVSKKFQYTVVFVVVGNVHEGGQLLANTPFKAGECETATEGWLSAWGDSL